MRLPKYLQREQRVSRMYSTGATDHIAHACSWTGCKVMYQKRAAAVLEGQHHKDIICSFFLSCNIYVSLDGVSKACLQ